MRWILLLKRRKNEKNIGRFFGHDCCRKLGPVYGTAGSDGVSVIDGILVHPDSGVGRHGSPVVYPVRVGLVEKNITRQFGRGKFFLIYHLVF